VVALITGVDFELSCPHEQKDKHAINKADKDFMYFIYFLISTNKAFSI